MRVLVAAGTSEAIEAVRLLAAGGCAVTASVVQPGAAAPLEGLGARVLVGRRDADGWRELLASGGYDAVVDAAHPFAEGLHQALRQAAAAAGLPCLRCERAAADLPDDARVRLLPDAESAALAAAACGGTVFLSTGVRDLAVYKRAADAAGVRIVARVLPLPESVEALLQSGFRPEDVVALRGPFGEEINRALFRHFGARVLVSKESGPRGSVPEKVRAALALDMQVVLVRRPEPAAGAVGSAAELGRLLLGAGADRS